MFNESLIYALFFGAAIAVMLLIWVWLEGVFYFIRDVMDRWNQF